MICRATELESERKLRLASADAVVAPQAVGAERLTVLAIEPELAQIFDVVINGNAVEFRNPGPSQHLTPGERLVVVGTKAQVDKAAELLKPLS